ncbi:ABC transporter substrate-binding protein [Microvirga sp. VF16]|uniref:ABC transporter substrate-binding protein n=1 Tax=Microvirga sp. VF16 TaxID=2807101 RepID=UPI00193E04F3|nr:ABC transporter substrate-binding protein [Microvirga sp. VF16]QRM28843.1 ABC transporter substrate-binding protein [Microvirga sp. VF16]
MSRQGFRCLLGNVLLLGLTLAIVGPAQAQSKPERVASLNLCTDQLLLALADRSQIASLSRLARDPSMAFLSDQAAGIPLNDSSAEATLFSRPDLVLAGTYGQQDQVALLRRQGLDVLSLGPWAGLEDGRGQIRTLARRLGHPDRGEALIARIDAALERAKEIVKPKRSILVYERGGWVIAPHSPLSEILVHMGFRLHEALDPAQGGVARLEAIVTTPPDFMLVDAASRQAVDNGTALFAHPALAESVPLDRRLALPSKLTICGGASTPVAIDTLGAEVRAKVR